MSVTSVSPHRRITLVQPWSRILTDIERYLPFIFLLFSLPVSGFFALTMPPSFSADEIPHIMRADSLLHGDFLGHRAAVIRPDGTSTIVAGATADLGLLGVTFVVPELDTKITAAEVQQVRAGAWGNPVFIALTNTARYAPLFYIPAAIGLGVSKALGASPLVAILVGRLLNLACYELLGLSALCLMRRCRALLFCLLMVPTSLSMAGSFNLDGLMIATMALAAALFSRCLATANSQAAMVRMREFWIATIALSCVILTIPPYLPFAALLLVPLPFGHGLALDRGTLSRLSGAIALCVLPALVWSLFVSLYVATPFIHAPYPPGPLFPGDPHMVFVSTDAAAQLQVLQAHPLHVLLMVFRELSNRFGTHLDGLIGVLGMLNVVLPRWYYRLWQLALVAAMIEAIVAHATQRWLARPMDCILPLIAGFICVIGIILSQYLTWTMVGATAIDGVQGRYFLPLLGLLPFALPSITLPGARSIRGACLLLAVATAAVGLFLLPPFVTFAYYLS